MISLFKQIFLYTILIIFIFLASIIYINMHPNKIHSKITPSDFGVMYNNISFYNKDHQLLKGWFIPSKNKNANTIILLHGYGADKGNILPTRIFLHEKYNLLFFDFHYFGESEGSSTTIGIKETDDLKAAIDYLHTRGINKVGVWGLSMGAAVAFVGASEMKEITAIVAESSYARLDMMADRYSSNPWIKSLLRSFFRLYCQIVYGINLKIESPMDAAKRLTIPVLLVHSKDDSFIPFYQAQLIEDNLKNNPHAQFVITEHLNHSEFCPGLKKIILNFFDKAFDKK